MSFNWQDHCKTHGIRYEYEGSYDVYFTAPKGKTFGNDSRHRIVEDIDEMSDHELEDCLGDSII